MSCVEVPESVKRLLEELSDGQEILANVLDHHAVTLAADNGWVYQRHGLVGLTGGRGLSRWEGTRGRDAGVTGQLLPNLDKKPLSLTHPRGARVQHKAGQIQRPR